MANIPEAAGRATLKRRRSVLAVGVLTMLLLFTQPQWAINSAASTLIRLTGLFFIVICVAGRSWCGLFIPQTRMGRLVVNGPYSIVRNPYHLFSIIGAIGSGFQTGCLIHGFAAGITAMMIFSSKIAREERFLANLHGTEYEYYRRHVRRFIPGLRHWHPGRLPSYSAEVAATGLLDSLHYFAAIPFALLLQGLHASSSLPIVLVFP